MKQFKIVCISLTNFPDEALDQFLIRINNVLSKISSDTDVIVFPEYCWGENNFEDVRKCIDKIRTNYNFNIVFGSHPFELEKNKTTNNAIISIIEDELKFSPKTIPMEGEKERNNIIAGENLGIIEINNIKVGIVICADLWNWRLIRDIVTNQKADILLVPAFTVVPKGHREYAKYQWLSLAITRSREFVVPIAIADHSDNGEIYDVGNVTCVIDPSRKDPSISVIEDFVNLPTDNFVSYNLNFGLIQDYREYRRRNGLLQK